MSEPSVEDIVARWEGLEVEIDALIASWRERGVVMREVGQLTGAIHALRTVNEGLRAMTDAINDILDHPGADDVRRIRSVLRGDSDD